MPDPTDTWILPSRQHDHPTRPQLAEAVLHARREATFLALAALFCVATVTPMLLGTSRMLDLAQLSSDLPFAMQLPLGVLAFPLGLVAVSLACELFGRRRAFALVATGSLVVSALVGVAWAADAIDGGATLGPALALAAAYIVAHVSHLLLFDSLRRRAEGRQRWLRTVLSPLLAQTGSWAAFAFVMYGYATATGEAESIASARVAGIAAGGCAYAIAFVLAELVPHLIAASALASYTRVGRFVEAVRAPVRTAAIAAPVRPAPVGAPARVAAAPVVPVVRPVPTRAERRAARSSIIQPFNSAEMRFFTEGDAIAEAKYSGELGASQPAGAS